MKKLNPVEAFWDRVQKTQNCWLWTGPKDSSGYGQLGRRYRAHRFSWELHYGPIPPGMCVLHRCDNPGCTRPDHLFLGTQRDNMLDAIAKARRSRVPPGLREAWNRNPRRKFSDAEVRCIRLLYESQRHYPRNIPRPYSLKGLGQMFGTSFVAIGHIVNFRVYKNVA